MRSLEKGCRCGTKTAPGHRRQTDDRELALSLIPVIGHTLLVAALTGQAFISSNIDRGIWFTGFVQKPMEISILDQTGIVDLVRGGIKHRITRPEILSRNALKEVELWYVDGIINQGGDGEIENLGQPFDFRNRRNVLIDFPFLDC